MVLLFHPVIAAITCYFGVSSEVPWFSHTHGEDPVDNDYQGFLSVEHWEAEDQESVLSLAPFMQFMGSLWTWPNFLLTIK